MIPSVTLVFFGSGPVAAATLEGLLAAKFGFEAVITKPRAPGFRGRVPVLELAEARDIPVFTPANRHELSALFETRQFISPIGLVVDYGIIISKAVIESFAHGIINSHFSLLPEWRGADPITFAILSGQSTTGVSLMRINEKLDEGQLIAQEPFILPNNITTPELTTRLVQKSNRMIINYLPSYLEGTIAPYPQPPQTPTYSRKLTKGDCQLDPAKPAITLEREVRAFRGWPKSKMTLFNRYTVTVLKARIAKDMQDGELVVACGEDSFLEILELIAPSGRTMNGAAFMRGYQP